MGACRRALPNRGRRIRVRGRRSAVTLFARQMSTLLGAGLPVLRSLETLARQQVNGGFGAVLRAVAGKVRSGASLSQAIGGYPEVFDPLLISMVRAGEASGDLPSVLAQLADFRERSARTRGKVGAAMLYPAIVMGVAACIVALLMVFVVPQFQIIFRDMLRGQPLPLLTQLVIDTSSLLKDRWLPVFAAIIVLWSGTGLVLRTRSGAAFRDRLLFACPGSRAVVRRSAIARFARTFGTLVRAGVPLLEALRISREVAGNAVVQTAIGQVHDQVRDGQSIARSLEATAAFPPIVASMIEVGEETAQLPGICDRLADAYEAELESVVAGLSSIVEPIMIVLLALVVGTIVIALFLPIVSIIQNLSVR